MFEKILVVDDDVNMRGRFYEILSSLGYSVTCVPIAEEALIRLRDERPDLILLDEDMPKLGGIDTARKIRKFDKDMKILILSDVEAPDDKKKLAADLNIQGIVKKDFSTHFMMKTILGLLKEKKTPRRKEKLPEKPTGPILVVDDSPEIRDILKTFLTNKGYKVTVASSGEEAIMNIKVEREKPRIVLLDFRMPGMDGIMVLKKIKQLNKSIEVVMITSAHEEYIINEAKKLGLTDHLFKPFDLQHLDTLILSLLVSTN